MSDAHPPGSPRRSINVCGSAVYGNAAYSTPGASNVRSQTSRSVAALIDGTSAPSTVFGAVETSVHVSGTATVIRLVSSTRNSKPAGNTYSAPVDVVDPPGAVVVGPPPGGVVVVVPRPGASASANNGGVTAPSSTTATPTAMSARLLIIIHPLPSVIACVPGSSRRRCTTS